MNARKLFLGLFLSVLCVGFTACGDDDDKVTTDYAPATEGTYTGTISKEGAVIVTNAQVTVKRIDVNKVNLTTPSMSIQVLQVGTVAIPEITCEATVGEGGSITGTTNTTVTLPNGPQMIPVTVSGTIANGTAQLNIGAMVVTVIFNGTK